LFDLLVAVVVGRLELKVFLDRVVVRELALRSAVDRLVDLRHGPITIEVHRPRDGCPVERMLVVEVLHLKRDLELE